MVEVACGEYGPNVPKMVAAVAVGHSYEARKSNRQALDLGNHDEEYRNF